MTLPIKWTSRHTVLCISLSVHSTQSKIFAPVSLGCCSTDACFWDILSPFIKVSVYFQQPLLYKVWWAGCLSRHQFSAWTNICKRSNCPEARHGRTDHGTTFNSIKFVGTNGGLLHSNHVFHWKYTQTTFFTWNDTWTGCLSNAIWRQTDTASLLIQLQW